MIVAVAFHVIPLLGGRQHEARNMLDLGDRPAVAVHLVATLRVGMDQFMIRAGDRTCRSAWRQNRHHTVDFAQICGRMSAERAAVHFDQIFVRHREPSR